MDTVKIFPSEITYDLSSTAEYTAVLMLDPNYGQDRMCVFYVPSSSVNDIFESYFRHGKILDDFILLRETGARAITLNGNRTLCSLLVESVTHPKLKSAVANSILKYKDQEN